MNLRVFSRFCRSTNVITLYISNVRCLSRSLKMAESEVHDKKPAFGNRFLTDPQNVFEHNAWDNVVWDEEQENEARKKTEEQLANPASEEEKEKYLSEASDYWDQFYQIHENKFFKDRQWLFTEFPELAPEFYLSEEELEKLNTLKVNETTDENDSEERTVTVDDITVSAESGTDNVSKGNVCDTDKESDKPEPVKLHTDTDKQGVNDGNTQSYKRENNKVQEGFPGESKKYRIFEVGCGAGNTVFPILQTNNDPELMVYCCDFSPVAVDIVKENKDYNSERCHAFVCDVSKPEASLPFPESSLDVIVMIFVLSAIAPDRMQNTLNRLAKLLKPGGVLMLRDYGRYDMAQLRFKKGRCLSENFYARGHGTLVYFFTQDELREMMTKAGLLEKQNYVDRRLQVNRGRQLKMYRVWLQCKYVKPKHCDDSSNVAESV